jgi:hypothetical protein
VVGIEIQGELALTDAKRGDGGIVDLEILSPHGHAHHRKIAGLDPHFAAHAALFQILIQRGNQGHQLAVPPQAHGGFLVRPPTTTAASGDPTGGKKYSNVSAGSKDAWADLGAGLSDNGLLRQQTGALRLSFEARHSVHHHVGAFERALQFDAGTGAGFPGV